MDNNIKLFYLRFCPYCKKAMALIDILQKENPDYAKIKIEKIEESENKKLADSFDYNIVPTFYIGNRKMFEGAMNKEDIKLVFDTYLKENSSISN